MPRTAGEGATKKTVKLPPHVAQVAPPPPITTKVTDPSPYKDASGNPISQSQIDASIAANPNASKGGYEGVGTKAAPGPAGTTNYGNPNIDQSATSDPSQDWASAFFGALGLPDDVMSQVVKVLRDHAQDQNLAQALATQYIRSTPWYQVHYPGALEGIANGTIQDERGYTQYMHQINALSQQYQGRAVSGDEVKGYLQAGYDTGYVGKLYGGQAWVAANRNDTQYTLGAFGDNGQLDQAGLTALGNENAGIDTGLGQKYAGDLQKATDRFRRIFQGTLAQGSTNGLQQRNQAQQTPDVAA